MSATDTRVSGELRGAAVRPVDRLEPQAAPVGLERPTLGRYSVKLQVAAGRVSILTAGHATGRHCTSVSLRLRQQQSSTSVAKMRAHPRETLTDSRKQEASAFHGVLKLYLYI